MRSAGGPIRVLHVVPSMSVHAGMTSVVMNYHHSMDRSAVQFDYLCLNSLREREAEARSMGAHVWYVPASTKLAKTATFTNFFRDHAEEFDILHCHPIFAPQLMGRVAKKYGVRAVIAHSHSTKFSEKPLSAVRNSFLSWFVGLGATDYIACSEGARVLLRHHGKDAYIMRNAIKVPGFKYSSVDRERIRDELGVNDNTLLIGTIGRCSREKNQEFLLDIAQALSKIGHSFFLVIVGDGPLRRNLESEIVSRGLNNCVTTLGSRSDTRALYSAFDCFLLPSFFEGLPVSAVEAQASGLPCLLSDAITREVAFGLVRYLPLSNGQIWADAVIDCVGQRKPARKGLVADAGFDVDVESVKLASYYKKLLTN